MKRRIEKTEIYYENNRIKSFYDHKEVYKKTGSFFFYDIVSSAVTAVIAISIIFTFIFRVVSVSGKSMVPTLHDADKLVVSRLNYTVSRSDIVVVSPTKGFDEPIIKRVIGIEGDTIDIDFEKGIVYRNGQALDEKYTNSLTNKSYDMKFPIVVRPGCVFVMGDNRNHSLDSRSTQIGLVDERLIIGKAVFRIYPAGNFKI